MEAHRRHSLTAEGSRKKITLAGVLTESAVAGQGRSREDRWKEKVAVASVRERERASSRAEAADRALGLQLEIREVT